MEREIIGDYEELQNLNKKKNIGFSIFFVLYIFFTYFVIKNLIKIDLKEFQMENLPGLLFALVFTYVVYGFVKKGFILLFLQSNRNEIKEYLDSIIKSRFKNNVNFSTKLPFSMEEADCADFFKEYTKAEVKEIVAGFENEKKFKGANLSITKTTGSGKHRKTEVLCDGLFLKIYMNNKFKHFTKITNEQTTPYKFVNAAVFIAFIIMGLYTKEIMLLVFAVIILAVTIFKAKEKVIKLKDENFDKTHDVFGNNEVYAEIIVNAVKKELMKIHLNTEVNVHYAFKDRFMYVAMPNTKILDPLYEKNYKKQLDQVYDIIDIIKGATNIAKDLDEKLVEINKI